MAKKLQNIKAIKQMLDGTHKFQTKQQVGYSAPAKEKRKVGETWTETDPITGVQRTYVQREGYRSTVGKFDEVRKALHSFAKCPKETCTCTQPGQADKKMKAIHGMCLDCVVDMEHELKMSGKFEEYAQEKINENIKSFFKQTDAEVEILKQEIGNQIEFVNSDGSMEKWDHTAKDAFLKKMAKDYKRIKKSYFKKHDL